MSKEKSIIDKVLLVGCSPCDCKIIQSYLDDIDVVCQVTAELHEAKKLCRSMNPNYYSLVMINDDLPHLKQINDITEMLGIHSPIISICPPGKNCDSITAWEFFLHIAPYVENAMLYITKLNNATGKLDKKNRIDSNVCNLELALSNMGSDVGIFLKYLRRFQKKNYDLPSRLAEMIDKGDYDEALKICSCQKEIGEMLGLTQTCGCLADLEGCLTALVCPAASLKNNAAVSNPDLTLKTNFDYKQLVLSLENAIASVYQMQF